MDNTIIQQGNSIIQMNNQINQQDNIINQHENAINQQGNAITQMNNNINQQNDNIESMNNEILAQSNNIETINNTISQHNNRITQNDNAITQMNNNINQQNNVIEQQGNVISQQGNAIAQQNNIINQHGNVIDQHNTTLQTVDSNIRILNSAFKIEDGVLTGLDEIIVNELETDHLNAKYANLDFTNINYAAVRKIFSDSGIIKDLIVQEGKITGELVGVTIKGDLIEGNTIKADKLVVRGEDGLYYKLNIDGLDDIGAEQASKFVLTVEEPDDWEINYKDYYIINNNVYTHVTGNSAPSWQLNTYYKLSSEHETGLDGTVIIAQSVTADKIQVSDLVAFDATIGGFNITEHSLYSGVKSSATNTTRGVFMNDSGEFAVGDSNNFLRYFLDTEHNVYKLEISAAVIRMGGSNKTVEEAINEINDYISEREIIVGTQNIKTRFWEGISNLDKIKDGTEIIYWLPYASIAEAADDSKITGVDVRTNASTVKPKGTKINTFEGSTNGYDWLNLTLKDGTKTGWIPCYYGGSTRLTTHYQAGNCIRMIYRVNANVAGVNYTGWYADANYNVDNNSTNLLRFQQPIKAKANITAGQLIVGTVAGFEPINENVVFDLDKPILVASTTLASGSTNGNNNFLVRNDVDIQKTIPNWNGIQYENCYLVGTINGNNFTITNPIITTTKPTDEDNLYYISLGYMYTNHQIILYPEHPIFKYVNGQFKNISQIAFEAQNDVNEVNSKIVDRNLILDSDSINLSFDDGYSLNKFSNEFVFSPIFNKENYAGKKMVISVFYECNNLMPAEETHDESRERYGLELAFSINDGGEEDTISYKPLFRKLKEYKITESMPDDWDTSYLNYYILYNNNYIPVTGDTAPNWEENKYYSLIINSSGIGRMYTVFTVPENWTGEILDSRLYIQGLHPDSIIKLYKPKLESGENLTDWTQAIEDLENIKDKIDDKISQNQLDEFHSMIQEEIKNSASVTVDSIKGLLEFLVTKTDSSGHKISAMTQTESGWTFEIDSLDGRIGSLQDSLSSLESNDGVQDTRLNDFDTLMENLNKKTAYIKIGTDSENKPTIILGSEESPFKVIITNTSIDFMNNQDKPAYVSGQIFYGQNITAVNQLKIGNPSGFIWKIHNGNLGLVYTSS